MLAHLSGATSRLAHCQLPCVFAKQSLCLFHAIPSFISFIPSIMPGMPVYNLRYSNIKPMNVCFHPLYTFVGTPFLCAPLFTFPLRLGLRNHI